MAGESIPAGDRPDAPAHGSPAPPAHGQPAPAASEYDRPSIAERAARRDELYAGGRDRYSALLRSLQAGQELQLKGGRGRVSIDWHPILWILVRVAIVAALVYMAFRFGTQLWRENHVDTWAGPTATVQSGVRLADCPIVDAIRVDDFPSWVRYDGLIYRYTGWKRPFTGEDAPGYAMTPYTNGAMRLVLLDAPVGGSADDLVLVWLKGALAGVEYAKTPECSPG